MSIKGCVIVFLIIWFSQLTLITLIRTFPFLKHMTFTLGLCSLCIRCSRENGVVLIKGSIRWERNSTVGTRIHAILVTPS